MKQVFSICAILPFIKHNINEMGALVLFYIKGSILTIYLLEWDASIVNSIFRVYQLF